jgi:hypothetical protein
VLEVVGEARVSFVPIPGDIVELKIDAFVVYVKINPIERKGKFIIRRLG